MAHRAYVRGGALRPSFQSGSGEHIPGPRPGTVLGMQCRGTRPRWTPTRAARGAPLHPICTALPGFAVPGRDLDLDEVKPQYCPESLKAHAPSGVTLLHAGFFQSDLNCLAFAPHTAGRARRADHHDFVAKLWQEACNQSAWKAEGSLGSVYNRLRYLLDSRDGPLYQPRDEARLAVEALYKYHLTDTATHRRIRVWRQGVSDETFLETVTHLHEEWRLICSIGFA